MGKIIRNGVEYSGATEDATAVNYNNSLSGLNAQTVQEAIDELSSSLGGYKLTTIDGKISYYLESEGADSAVPFSSGVDVNLKETAEISGHWSTVGHSHSLSITPSEYCTTAVLVGSFGACSDYGQTVGTPSLSISNAETTNTKIYEKSNGYARGNEWGGLNRVVIWKLENVVKDSNIKVSVSADYGIFSQLILLKIN